MKMVIAGIAATVLLTAQASAQNADPANQHQPAQSEVSIRDLEHLKCPESPMARDEATPSEWLTFDFNQSCLKPHVIATLEEAVKALNEYPEIKAEVAGHADSMGSDDYNQQLSLKRARAVYLYLTSRGIDPSRLKPTGYGESRPIAPNINEDGSDYPDGRSRNRRVELNAETRPQFR